MSSEESLKRIENLLLRSLAVQLYQAGCKMDDIAKHLRVGKVRVVEMLKGVKPKQYGN